MKNFTLLAIAFFCFSLLGYSQTETEKQKIISTYNYDDITNLRKLIQSNSKAKDNRINAYLFQNKKRNRVEIVNNKKYEIVDIIDNNPIYRSTNNINSAISTRTNFLHNGGGLGLNLEGQNMTIGVWDSEQALSSHVEFLNNAIPATSRITKPDFLFGDPTSFHATHVAGTIIAKGNDSAAKGMASQAELVSYNWTEDAFEVSNEITDNALLLSNHSYGIHILLPSGAQNAPTWMMGCYNDDAVEWDNIAYTFPYYLQVTSAGNGGQSVYSGGTLDGYDKLTGDKNAKNNLVVASANNPTILANGDLSSMTISSFSSQGPCDDGRIKPDITGDGADLFSTSNSSNTSYGTTSGTSMSSPNVAGSLLLLQQYYNNLNSQFLKAATLKGLVCHTADDDSSSPGPDPIFGWGLLNTKAAAETILDDTNNLALISELALSDGETYSYPFTSPGTGPISVTLCWSDPPGPSQQGITNSTTPALVNDLDLRLKHPNGFLEYQPWKLRTFNIAGEAITGDNLVDTVENIDLDSPSSGIYTIEISHKGTLVNPQDFSLILTGTGITLDTPDFSESNFTIWPNPADSELNFRYNSINSSDSKITLVDMQGRVIHSDLINPLEQIVSGKINTSNYSNGVYFLNIEQGNAELHKKVIIK